VTKEWTLYRGLATPEMLSLTQWIAELSLPDRLVSIGHVSKATANQLRIMTESGAVTSRVDPDGTAHAAITVPAILALKLGCPAGVYRALRPASHLRMAKRIADNPNARVADLLDGFSQRGGRDALIALCRVHLAIKHHDDHEYGRPARVHLTETGARLVDIATKTPVGAPS
jgi:hypothetical protein